MFEKTYAKYFDVLNKDKNYRKEIKFVYKWTGKPEIILDIGCGTACYWKYLPTPPIGIEQSEYMIKYSEYKKHIICADITQWKPITPLLVDSAYALFDVINYTPCHSWWKNLPIKKGGYFAFDVWDSEKVRQDGFETTFRRTDGVSRVITPLGYTNKQVNLQIDISDPDEHVTEIHKMYIYSYKDIKKFAGKDFDIVDIQKTERWQKWFKLKKR